MNGGGNTEEREMQSMWTHDSMTAADQCESISRRMPTTVVLGVADFGLSFGSESDLVAAGG